MLAVFFSMMALLGMSLSVFRDHRVLKDRLVHKDHRDLREKVEINPSEPRYLKVVWGRGYKMEVVK